MKKQLVLAIKAPAQVCVCVCVCVRHSRLSIDL